MNNVIALGVAKWKVILSRGQDFISLRERGHEKGRGRRRGRSRLPAEQGTRGSGAPSQDPEVMTPGEAGRLIEPPRRPNIFRN